MPAPSLSAPYTLELVTYDLNDDADAETFLALNREVGKLLPAFGNFCIGNWQKRRRDLVNCRVLEHGGGCQELNR